jgi:hypothetical protein
MFVFAKRGFGWRIRADFKTPYDVTSYFITSDEACEKNYLYQTMDQGLIHGTADQ